MTVKEIAQLLQTFGTELSETELPDEASSIEYLLRSHTEKFRQMKVWGCSCSCVFILCTLTVGPDVFSNLI